MNSGMVFVIILWPPEKGVFFLPCTMHSNDFCAHFASHAHPENAQAMSAYLKHRLLFFGIRTPFRRKLFRQVVAAQCTPDEIEALNLSSIILQDTERLK